jgi:hypothetical protein
MDISILEVDHKSYSFGKSRLNSELPKSLDSSQFPDFVTALRSLTQRPFLGIPRTSYRERHVSAILLGTHLHPIHCASSRSAISNPNRKLRYQRFLNDSMVRVSPATTDRPWQRFFRLAGIPRNELRLAKKSGFSVDPVNRWMNSRIIESPPESLNDLVNRWMTEWIV